MSKNFEKKFRLPICAIAAFLLASTAFAEERGRALFNLCISCHGQEGYGDRDAGGPAIAGLPQSYIEAQLEKFTAGGRGAHPDDDDGNRMRPMARTLSGDDIKTISEYVSSLKPIAPMPTLGGNLEKGKAAYATCAACHGPTGEGNLTMHAPPLKISNDWYLLRQLNHFKAKIRAGDPLLDPMGAPMTGMASTLPDEQAMKDVISYVQSMK